MGTVADKIKYIDGTKSAIKEAIIKKGVEVDDSLPFRQYADKIKAIEGGSSIAEYVYQNIIQEVEFPREIMTAENWKSFSFNFVDDLEGFKNSEYEFSTFCRTPQTGTAYIAWFDNLYTTEANMAQDKFFKFNTPVLLSKLKFSGDAQTLRVYGTNTPEYVGDTGNMTLIKSIDTQSSLNSMIELEVGAKEPYQFYYFKNNSNYSSIKELRFVVLAGNLNCALSSTNMTPEIKAYPTDYMKLITQSFYNGIDIVPSQTLIMKPYEDGGNLINYIDNGSAVNLKIFWCESNGQQVLSQYVQPILFENGTLGQTKPACSASVNQTPAYYAFDGSENTKWQSGSPSTPQNIIFYDPQNFIPTDVEIKFVNGEVYASGEIFGSNANNNDWVSLASFDNNELDNMSVSFENETEYHYLKIQFNSLYSGWGQIYEIKINGKKKTILNDMYLISPNDIELPEGYVSSTYVTEINIPAHIYFDGENWVMGQ